MSSKPLSPIGAARSAGSNDAPSSEVIDFERTGPSLVLLETDPIRVLIADSQPVIRAGLTAMLEGEQDIGVSGVAGTAEDAVSLAAELRPHVALIDLDLPGTGGLEAARRIREHPDSEDVNVMILATHDSDDDLFGALLAGALGFVLKSSEPAELVQAVRVLASGEALLSPSATRRLIAEFRTRPQPHMMPRPDQLDELTAREREVMALVAAGLRNDEIAERFVISPATVKTHVSRVRRKLDAHDRSQLVAIAYQIGLVRTDAVRTDAHRPPPRVPACSTRRAPAALAS
jgi:DNA-binding NarL/FixJ family response regulator